MVGLGGVFFGTPAAARLVPTLPRKKFYFFLQKKANQGKIKIYHPQV